MTLVFKVSKDGYDVKNETNPENFIFNSEYGSVVIYEENEVEVTIAAGSSTKSTVTFNRTFDYVPVVFIFAELTPGSGRWYISPFIFGDGYTNSESCYVVQTESSDTGVEEDQFYITFYNTTGSEVTIKYRYYILANLG
jgi:hypothetical protein